MKRSLLFSLGGLAYGLLLAAIGMGAANGGDGVMIPLYVYGSPLFVPLLFFAPIVVWPIVTVMLNRAHQQKFKNFFISLMAIHYIGAVVYLTTWGDWDHFFRLWNRSPFSVLILVASYLIGQVTIWFLFAATHRVVASES